MSNTMTAVLPVLMARALQTLRQNAVLPRLINTDYANLPAGQGDTVNMPIPSAVAVADVSASNTLATGTNVVPTKATVTLNKWRKAGFAITDKERGEIPNGIIPGQLDEVVKALANDVNSYVLGLYTGVWGWAGAAAQTPFATNLSEATDARKVLADQLCPPDDRRGLLDTAAEANLTKLLANWSLRGSDQTVVTGGIGRILGMDWYMSQAVPTHTANADGAGASTVNGVNNAGATSVSIAKAAGASKSALVGDVLDIASGPAKGTYVITEAVTIVHTNNTTVKISPPLRGATAGGETVTYKATHVVNLAFHKDAFAFASRALQSDAANGPNIMSIADPVSKLVFRLEMQRQNKQDYIEADILYGATLVRPELACRIAG